MASNSQKEVDLVIRAKDQSVKVLGDTQKAIDAVTSSLADQADQAGTTDKAVDTLDKSFTDLQSSQKDLAKVATTLSRALDATGDSLDKATTREQALSEALDKANQDLAANVKTTQAAASAYTLFAADILAIGPPTRTIASQLAKLSEQGQEGGKAFTTLTNKVNGLQGQLFTAEQATEKLAAGLEELNALSARVVASQNAVSAALDGQSAASARASVAAQHLAAQQANSAAAQQAYQANLTRLTAQRTQAQAAADQASATAAAEVQQRNAALAATQKANNAAALSAYNQRIQGLTSEQAARKSSNAEVDRSSTLLDKLTGSQRESLSWYQRVRGELIATATAYVGLQGAIGLASSALDSIRKRTATESALSVAAGSTDPKVIGDEYAYIAGQADRLGVRLDDLATSYAKFSVAAKTSGATTNQTRFIFEKVAETARVMHLSVDDTNGVFLALQQMMSKGNIQAEELRGQLGERLPAAVALFAKSMGIGAPELNKQLQAGTVTAKELIGFAKTLGDEFGKQLPAAVQNMTAQEARLYNATVKFKQAIADNGFADAWTNFAEQLTKLLQGDDGAKFASSISSAFTSVINILQSLISNLNIVGDFFITALGVKALAAVSSFVIGMVNLQGSIAAAAASQAALAASAAAAGDALTAEQIAAGKLEGAIAGINKVFLILSAAFAGWEAGNALADKFEIVRLAGTAAVESIEEAWINVQYGVQIAGAEIASSLVDAFASALKNINDFKNGFLGKLSDAAKFIGLDKIGDTIAGSIKDGVDTGLDAAKKQAAADLASLKQQRAAALAENKKEADEQYAEDLRRPALRLNTTTPPKATQLTDTSGGLYDVKGLPNTKGAQKLLNTEQSVAEQLNQLYKGVEKNYEDNLDSRLSAVQRTYQNIYDTIAKYEKLGGTTVDGQSLASVKAQLQTLEQQAMQQETLKFNTQQLAKQEQGINDVLKERSDFQKDIAAQVKSGAIDAADGFKQIADENDKIAPKLSQMAKDAITFANGVRGTGIPDTKIDAFVSKMTQVGGQGTTGPQSSAATAGTALVNQQMTQINETLAQRNSLVSTYNDLVKLGAVTQDEANDKIKAAYTATAPALTSQVEALKDLIQEMSAAGDISTPQLDALNAKLIEIQTNAQYVDADWAKVRQTFTGSLSQDMVQGVDSILQSITAAAEGTESWGDAFKDVGNAFLNFLANFLKSMADAIAQIVATKLALQALKLVSDSVGSGASSGSSGVDYGSLVSGLIASAGAAHGGGMIGNGPTNMTRSVSPSVFANAPRYHSGTVVGLRSDEQATILQKGEEVLSKDNPRNIMNQTAASAAKGASGTNIRNILVTDPNFVPDALATSQGEQTLITMLQRNRAGFRKALGVN